MKTTIDEPAGSPVFSKCVRCGYSLRGLPANHACPECGLRFDERCELYRVANPKQVLAFWIMIFGGGWIVLRNLSHLTNFAAASTWEKVGALTTLLWLCCIPAFLWLMIRHYRRGFEVAVTGDGLIVRLPGVSDELIPWSNIKGASVKDTRADKHQVTYVRLKDKRQSLHIGGAAKVFPTRADAERFARQVNERVREGAENDAQRT